MQEGKVAFEVYLRTRFQLGPLGTEEDIIEIELDLFINVRPGALGVS